MVTSAAEVELRRVMRCERRPVAFVGAGLSTNHGSWEHFVREMARHTHNSIGFKFLSARGAKPDLETLLVVADESVDQMPTPAAMETFVKQYFASPPDKMPSVYGALARAPFAFYLTTNYDTNIEDAYRMHWGVPLEVIRSDQPERVLQNLASGTPFVFKIHGCAKHGGPFVIGSKDYQRAIFGNQAVQSVLHAVFATHSIVFMGYGHRDPHIGMYLGYQRQILDRGGPPHFTFIKKRSTCGYDQRQYFRRRFGISCIEIDDWSVVEVILDQLSFLQVRDDYAGTRRKQVDRFHEFIEGKREAAWGALLYAHASSDIGRAEDCFKLWQVVQDNAVLKEHIECIPSLHFVFCLISGQILKRKDRRPEAQHQFETIERLASSASPSHLIRPLRSLGLRYAGIFWHPEDPKRANELFTKAKKILGTEFPEDLLDHRKWAAVVAGSARPRRAALDLVAIAEEADRIGYLKCGAWCRYGAVHFLRRRGIFEPRIHQESLLMRAIRAFEQLEHMRGLADSYYLLAEIWHASGKNPGEILPRLELARSMAVIAGAEPTRKRCDALLSSVGGPPP
jgi:SIR2-like protein